MKNLFSHVGLIAAVFSFPISANAEWSDIQNACIDKTNEKYPNAWYLTPPITMNAEKKAGGAPKSNEDIYIVSAHGYYMGQGLSLSYTCTVDAKSGKVKMVK